MNDLQSKFAITLVCFGLLWAYAIPMLNEAKQGLDATICHVGTVYIAPNPNDPNAPSGNVSIDVLQKYTEKKAAEQKAMGLQ